MHAIINSQETKKGGMAFKLLQESDLRYLIDVIWSQRSAISGHAVMDDLILTRWDKEVELSPWNCILLTKNEALSHECSGSNESPVYSTDFKTRVFQRLLAARQHFGGLPKMAEYLRDNYVDVNGKLLLRT